jgi:hypothetical protein
LHGRAVFESPASRRNVHLVTPDAAVSAQAAAPWPKAYCDST